ncbi:MAG TPA: DUF5336 domain-containing protein [Jatrophihabitantaceae bacterium]|jgi:hypothetical protein
MTDNPAQWHAPRRFAGRQPALEWAAVGLGGLTFVFGFLDWYGTDSGGLNGYRLLDGYLPVGLALVASLLAMLNLRPDRTERTAWLAIGLSALAVLFTVVAMAVKPTFVVLIEGFSALDENGGVHLEIQVGLILTLVSAVLQLGCLVAAWLFATGRLAIGGVRATPQPSGPLPSGPLPSGPPPGSAPPSTSDGDHGLGRPADL